MNVAGGGIKRLAFDWSTWQMEDYDGSREVYLKKTVLDEEYVSDAKALLSNRPCSGDVRMRNIRCHSYRQGRDTEIYVVCQIRKGGGAPNWRALSTRRINITFGILEPEQMPAAMEGDMDQEVVCAPISDIECKLGSHIQIPLYGTCGQQPH